MLWYYLMIGAHVPKKSRVLSGSTSGYKIMVGINKTQEYVKLSARLWLWESYDSLHFYWKQKNPITVNEVPQKFNTCNWCTKNIFQWVGDNTIVA